MFVLVAQRPEFLDKWSPLLSARGEVSVVDGLPGLQVKLQAGLPAAIVVDRLLLGDAAPGFLAVLKSLCGESCLLLGDTGYQAEDELLALAAGIAACCDASLGARDIDRIVGIVLDGGIWISPKTLPELANRLQSLTVRPADGAAAEKTLAGLGELTQRQRDVADLVAKGESHQRIARRLDITERTVKSHLTTIFDKLGLTDRLQLALFVSRRSSDRPADTQ